MSWTIIKLSNEEPMLWIVELEKTLESPLDRKENNQSILKEISPEYSLEGLMLKLKLQYFGHLIQRADSFEKTLMLGKIEGRRRRRRQRMRWLDGITDLMDMSLSKFRELVEGSLACCSPWGRKESDMTEWLNWTDWIMSILFCDHLLKHLLFLSLLILSLFEHCYSITNRWL